MSDVSGFPYFEVQFNRHGEVEVPDQVQALLHHVRLGTESDLIVLAHGWNNDIDDARRLYRSLLAELRKALNARRIAGAPEDFVILAVLWPSKKFSDDELAASPSAGLDSLVSDAVLVEQINILKEAAADPLASAKLESAKTLVSKLDDSPKAQAEFADLVRSMLPTDAAEGGEEDASQNFFEMAGNDLMERLAKPVDEGVATTTNDPEARPTEIDGVGGAAGLGEFFSGMKSAARNLLNFSTYYLMKERSGTVGVGLNNLLGEIRTFRPQQKIHLVGHSFGARLVTAAAGGKDSNSTLTVQSMVLLQAAFSHNGFAVNFDENRRNGAFRRVIEDKLVRGPLLVSYTVNDKAVGIAYPLASLISGTDSSGLGDANDPFGGLGRNGAQHTPEAITGFLLPPHDKYEFEGGRIYNLHADSVIADHGDIVHPEIAHAMVSAIAAA